MITDWDDAYTNGAYIPGGDGFPERWRRDAAAYRETMLAAGRARLDLAYGPAPPHGLDLFLPEGAPRGLAVFVHGGFWMAFDKSTWSHFAAGAVAAGWALAMPSYTLAPAASVAEIARETARAIAHAAALVEGPIRLAGHSAGGQLVTRLICKGGPLDPAVLARVERVVSVSGLHDLRPLLRTCRRSALFRDPIEATAESPALLEPAAGIPVTCWVGSIERPEFLRQNDLLAHVWTGLGADMRVVHDPGRHHFDVLDGLLAPDLPLARSFVGEA